MTNKSWCPLPWMSVSVRNNGDVRLCCNANVSENQGLILNEDGIPYNLGKDNIDDFRNSPQMKEIRLTMLRGEYHTSCTRCKREDEAGIESRKVWERELWNHVITEQEASRLTDNDGAIDISENKITYTDLRFGNLCNLKCRMCGPTDSNQWYEDQSLVWDTNSYKDSGKIINLVRNKKGRMIPDNDIYSWYENPNFWKDLENKISELEHLYIVGGEPLLIDQHYDFLQLCIDAGRSKHIIVEYNTNITNIPNRAWDIWKHFKRIQCGISVDGVGKINDYIRHPSKWSQIKKNLHSLDNAEGNFKVWWAATIQAYNLIHFPDMMLWKIEQDFKRINKSVLRKPVISPHPLHNPKFLNIKIFPIESKNRILKIFEEKKVLTEKAILSFDFMNDAEKETNIKYFVKLLDQYSNYMMAEDYSSELEKFWHYTNRLDDIRQESLKNTCPLTWELLEGYNYENTGRR
jgi:sulfatase maturation enzyme AslB (radical SAM superfamily)